MPPVTLDLLLLVLIIALGLTFDFINGFHDTANAIATSVATRVLSPGRAVLMAGVLNFLGALSGTAVATTVGKGIVPPELSTQSLVFSPFLGFLGAFIVMLLLLNLFAASFPATVTRIFGRAQVLSAAWMAFSHGSNDAQKTMGVMTMALASYFGWGGSNWAVPLWVIVAAATAMALGTSIGGWRIIRTMGLRVVAMRPIHGFAAETASAAVIEFASRLGVPVSTTHTISSAILGVGSTRRLSAVRWGVAGQIVMGWVFTIPACFLMAWTIRSAIGLVGG